MRPSYNVQERKGITLGVNRTVPLTRQCLPHGLTGKWTFVTFAIPVARELRHPEHSVILSGSDWFAKRSSHGVEGSLAASLRSRLGKEFSLPLRVSCRQPDNRPGCRQWRGRAALQRRESLDNEWGLQPRRACGQTFPQPDVTSNLAQQDKSRDHGKADEMSGPQTPQFFDNRTEIESAP